MGHQEELVIGRLTFNGGNAGKTRKRPNRLSDAASDASDKIYCQMKILLIAERHWPFVFPGDT